MNRPDGTSCASQPGGVIDGTCNSGLCRRSVLDPCAQMSCPLPGPCYESSSCSAETGEAICRNIPWPEGRNCDDGNPGTYNDKCIEGRCVGDRFAIPKFQHLGDGICADHEGVPVHRYFGDVMDKAECEVQCANDPGCTAFSYGYHLCNIHGTRRANHPEAMSWGGKQWMLGNLSGEIFSLAAVQGTLGSGEGDTKLKCYRKAQTGDTEEDDGSLAKDIFLGCLVGILALLPGARWLCLKAPKYCTCCRRCCRCCPRCCRCSACCREEEEKELLEFDDWTPSYDEDSDEDQVVPIGDKPLRPKDGASKVAALPQHPFQDDAGASSEDDGLPVASPVRHSGPAATPGVTDPRGEVEQAAAS